jgi:hypothetical protein
VCCFLCYAEARQLNFGESRCPTFVKDDLRRLGRHSGSERLEIFTIDRKVWLLIGKDVGHLEAFVPFFFEGRIVAEHMQLPPSVCSVVRAEMDSAIAGNNLEVLVF